MNYVMSDIHGEYSRFLRMLKNIEFSSNDILYIVGDIPSRGKETFKLLDWVMNANNVIHIKGNHELFLQLYLEGESRVIANYSNYGGTPVIQALKDITEDKKFQYQRYLSSLPLYAEVSVNSVEYILTHSGFLVDETPVLHEDGSIDIVASIEEWCKKSEFKYLISNDLHYIPATVKYKKLIVGHHPTAYLDCDGIYHGKRYIDVDNGVNVIPQKKLACLRLEDMQEFYI
jgi:serine/threonine protein phosphatase 1